MNFFDFLKDKLFVLLILFFYSFFSFLFFEAFSIPFWAYLFLLFFLFFLFLFSFFKEFIQKRKFYETLKAQISSLDKAYFVLETLEKPSFLEGKLLYEALYEINKSMCEEVKKLELQNKDFKDYIEMWIHEVKIPISSLLLMVHNQKSFSKEVKKQIDRIYNDVEQVLYYARCENAEVDYFIKEVSLSKVISEVALKNKEELLNQEISLLIDVKGKTVSTDSKWLLFILNQILNNSIKYRSNERDSFIQIFVEEEKTITKLNILDNGIGIPESDIKKVFEKTFTGKNGRTYGSATGMGLFIVKSLCEKLGHSIEIFSKENEYTQITITFCHNSYYDVLR